MSNPTILFLDDDPVIRIARSVLCNEADSKWLSDYFAPEIPDLSPLVKAANGITRNDGVTVLLASDEEISDFDPTVIVFRRGVLTRASIAGCHSLKLIQRLGERADGIDMMAAHEHGVAVSCLSRRTLNYTAEHALLLMLALGKRLTFSDRVVRQPNGPTARRLDGAAYNWPDIGGLTGLNGKTLGVIGLGEVGTLVVRLARAFGMNVLYTKRTPLEAQYEASLGASYDTLPGLLGRADFVSLHAANVPENRGLMGDAEFAAMQSHAFFVNTSRGSLVNEDALYEALTSGVIAGAGLDVHGVEPRGGKDRFCRLENVVLTPHIAGGPRTGVLDELRIILENCRAAIEGTAPSHLVVGFPGPHTQ
jgi:phosphoglycerate dehydrogenase-like enzyme